MNRPYLFPRNFYYKIFISLFRDQYAKIQDIKTKEDLDHFTKVQLKQLFIHCYENVPYYKNIFSNLGVLSAKHAEKLSLDRLPILTKKDIRDHFKELSSQDINRRNWYHNSSGGSTGEPVRLIQDADYRKWNHATYTYYYEKVLGIKRIITKEVRLWGNERDIFQGNYGIKKHLQNHFTNTILLNSFRMTEKDIKKYISIINETKPDYIRGYAGSLYELCSFSQANKISLFSPKTVVSAAETLTNDMRNVIETGFNTKVYNFYGSRETDNLAGECIQGYLHIFSFNNIIEIVDENNQPVNQGEEGRILVTPLHNYSMPLLRYDIGDMGIKGPDTCPCGNFLPTVKAVTGRITDHFKLLNGTHVPAELFIHLLGVVCNKGVIKKFQVVQEDYNKIHVNIVPNAHISYDYTQDIENKIRVVMGQGCEITWNLVNEIPKTKSGKYRYTISKIK